MTSIEDIMEKACEERDIPGAILVAADKSGKSSFEIVNQFSLIKYDRQVQV